MRSSLRRGSDSSARRADARTARNTDAPGPAAREVRVGQATDFRNNNARACPTPYRHRRRTRIPTGAPPMNLLKGLDAAMVRAWARATGRAVGARGAISASLYNEYIEAVVLPRLWRSGL